MITHPDLPDTLVHFTGRSRGPKERQDFPPTTAEDRLVSILHSGTLRGAAPFGLDAPVLCFSEATEEARRVILRDGAGWGPYESWGLVLHRQQLIAAGARPVLYVSREERDQMKAVLPRRTYNRCVVYEPGREDWLHEREWRLCFEDDVEPVLPITPQLVAGVIVGTQGWTPQPREVTFEARAETYVTGVLAVRRAMQENPGHSWPSVPIHSPDVSFAWPAHGLARWYWTGAELVFDGYFDVQAQQWETAWRWGGALPGISGTVRPEDVWGGTTW
ncbi:hypothetical protein [Streptomyces hydrogenans]|uniref:Uncharacterized protein n=1 Tax=Streptomyces hydrogenans TaxID=1873719 RepID=A0ABQ3PHF9_9ACTN|nr:hypothetical protein [Streptomyces hydrogenans]GHG35380.1 hypothetical protein GCM10018784_56080 [Streptomyces hydrogenans]GHI20342.1 hypothetical protein Shyd_17130 [Streptomyces hydrogenans]GHI20490.1 hypothetical protein Shyd_18610 [Streptomyces hydrogenans]GHI22950.1 hypothetical protein Shyd_43210 [Streptomyces hydrogenans]GHI23375.1 hypothetical protein Shyd_47460 [Streptomyces hydrogenans]